MMCSTEEIKLKFSELGKAGEKAFAELKAAAENSAPGEMVEITPEKIEAAQKAIADAMSSVGYGGGIVEYNAADAIKQVIEIFRYGVREA